ncbi:MAG: bacillithiol biosynthesis BshC, partial [Taibaiella sp.]|nr:bacillithiol biosynthesis BshC [Taibaiella sp.]
MPYSQTGYFSQLVVDYLEQKDNLQAFYTFSPNGAGINKAVAERGKFPVDRQLLVNTLQKQYSGLQTTKAVTDNIAALANEN